LLTGTTFRALLDHAPDGIVAIERSGRIVLANRQAHELFGYPPGTLVGASIEMLLPETQRGIHQAHREQYMAAPRTRAMGAGLDLTGLRRDGTEFAVEISLSPIQSGPTLLVMAAVRDITDRKAAEAQIKRLNEDLNRRVAELAAVNRELEAFSYSVSHDLRAPLRALDGFSQALVEDAGDQLSPDAQDHVRRIRAAATRMGRLIDDLLELARLTRREMRWEPVDLTALARTVAERLRRSEPDRAVDFSIAGDLRVTGDSHLLQVAVQNLLGNAWKFTGKQGYARIEFGADTRDGTTVYQVRDNGVGFDMAYADKLFGAFQRLHAADEFAGTGIGLATVQRVITRHGGRVWASAEAGKGATFFFTLGAAP
jgi:PAS domain S-box-containing protein